MVETAQDLWNQLLEFTGMFVVPDWDWLLSIIPVLIFLLVGGALTLGLVAWFIYFLRKPRTRLAIDDGPRPAARDDQGQPIAPPGEPFCVRDAVIYPLSTLRCERCSDLLTVTCPMCGLARTVDVGTCANCGLVLRIDPSARTRVARPAGPPPGGAAIA
jgi:hypothetical protein